VRNRRGQSKEKRVLKVRFEVLKSFENPCSGWFRKMEQKPAALLKKRFCKKSPRQLNPYIII
jgi:hypothetical protein